MSLWLLCTCAKMTRRLRSAYFSLLVKSARSCCHMRNHPMRGAPPPWPTPLSGSVSCASVKHKHMTINHTPSLMFCPAAVNNQNPQLCVILYLSWLVVSVLPVKQREGHKTSLKYLTQANQSLTLLGVIFVLAAHSFCQVKWHFIASKFVQLLLRIEFVYPKWCYVAWMVCGCLVRMLPTILCKMEYLLKSPRTSKQKLHLYFMTSCLFSAIRFPDYF